MFHNELKSRNYVVFKTFSCVERVDNMGMYSQMRLSHANVNQHRIDVNYVKYLSLTLMFTEKKNQDRYLL